MIKKVFQKANITVIERRNYAQEGSVIVWIHKEHFEQAHAIVQDSQVIRNVSSKYESLTNKEARHYLNTTKENRFLQAGQDRGGPDSERQV